MARDDLFFLQFSTLHNPEGKPRDGTEIQAFLSRYKFHYSTKQNAQVVNGHSHDVKDYPLQSLLHLHIYQTQPT